MSKSSGTIANANGSNLESFIERLLIQHGYEFIAKKEFEAAICIKQPIYTKQFCIGTSIYETLLYCDFILYHPNKYPLCLVIESKWQQSSGSVDEKYPFLVLNIKKSPYKTVLLLDGQGYKPQAEKWLRNQIDDKLLHVFNMVEFQKWTNKGNI